MATTEARTTDADETRGAQPHRVVDPIDATGRMTVRAPDGDERTVVGCLDGRVHERLSGRAPGATVRMELSPSPAGDGYVAARVLPGCLPAL